MGAQTFRRAKMINIVIKYQRFMADAKRDMEDYAMRERTATNEQSKQYYAELKEQYRVKYHTYGCLVADLKYEFGVQNEEMVAG